MSPLESDQEAKERVYGVLLDWAEGQEDLEEVALVATGVVALDLEVGRGCDGCDRVMDAEILSAAGFTYSQALDGNGEPDVQICPVCVDEAERHPGGEP